MSVDRINKRRVAVKVVADLAGKRKNRVSSQDQIFSGEKKKKKAKSRSWILGSINHKAELTNDSCGP